jgi:thiamine-monophosphate kinase
VGPPPDGCIGIGDDAAVLPPAGASTLFTTDSLVEGIHFRPDWLTPAELGGKALAVNLSDLAAMGGAPGAALVSLALPPDLPVSVVDGCFRGLRRLARREGVSVVGGNLTRAERLTITVALTGTVAEGRPVLRSGALPGDRLVVSGQPGLARLGWRLLARASTGSGRAYPPSPPPWRQRLARSHSWARRALARFLTPEPRLAQGRLLARAGAHAMLDLSDGPARDLHRLAAASEVAIVLDPATFPCPRGFRELSARLGEDPIQAMLEGGEDYELAAALPADALDALPGSWTAIGTVVEGRGVFLLDGKSRRPLAPAGYDHFLGGKGIRIRGRRGRPRR